MNDGGLKKDCGPASVSLVKADVVLVVGLDIRAKSASISSEYPGNVVVAVCVSEEESWYLLMTVCSSST